MRLLFQGDRIVSIIWHVPNDYIDRNHVSKVSDLIEGQLVTLYIEALSHKLARRKGLAHRVQCSDETGEIDLVFFHGSGKWIEDALAIAEYRFVSGKVEKYQKRLQMVHPDYILTEKQREEMPKLEPIYPMMAGIGKHILLKTTNQMIEKLPSLPEWQNPSWCKQQNWPSWKKAVTLLHRPKKLEDIKENAPARERLVYDELLANQLALRLTRAFGKKHKGKSYKGNGEMRKAVLSALPYELTPSQVKGLDEIYDAQKQEEKQIRLLQGDVGSGKTLLALLAMLNVVETGAQATLMAPTELLACQHFKNISQICAPLNIEIACFLGRDSAKEREEKREKLRKGQISIAIGTHALFQEGVEFAQLGLAVIDEQHRFGVRQRMALLEKNRQSDVLVMTATPIPRTLSLIEYGDVDVSYLLEKPPGRKPIETRTISLLRLNEVEDALSRAIQQGNQVYWVCPAIEEDSGLAATEARFRALSARFNKEKIGFIHGQMPSHERQLVMEKFLAGEITILVATTVIEVGVDVPSASIMVIEEAERFGLAQLHQLRGRVGRGDKKSSCLLLYKSPLTKNARTRLEVLRKSDDGFFIAEEDLRLRGAGELLGTRQSGLSNFHFADLPYHEKWLLLADKEAQNIIEEDKELTSARGKSLRILLYLFQRDEAIGCLCSG